MKLLILTVSISALLLLSNIQQAVAAGSGPTVIYGETVELPQSKTLATENLIPISEAKNSKAWDNFIRTHGNWNILLNKLTGTPVSAFGKSIKISGYDKLTKDNVYEASMKFIKDNEDVLGVKPEELAPVRATNRDDRWYVTYRQVVNGSTVYGSQVDLRMYTKGSVAAFFCKFYPNVSVDETNIRSADALKNYSLIGLTDLGNNHDVQTDGKLYIIPMELKDKIEYKSAYKYYVSLYDKLKKYEVFVDANTGAILSRTNSIYDATNIQLDGYIKFKNPTQNDTLVHFPNQYVTVNGTQYTTDGIGGSNFDLPSNAQLSYNFNSVHSDMSNYDGSSVSNPEFNLISGSENPLLLQDDNSDLVERTLTYHANRVHQFYWNLDSSVNVTKHKSHIFLDWSVSSPNAYSNWDTIVFVSLGYNMVRMGQSSEVLYHEYGHTYNNFFYKEVSGGSVSGLTNPSIHEGMADVSSSMIWDVSAMGNGVFVDDPGRVLRDLDNTLRYPEDIEYDPHHNGMIIGGAFWDLRKYTSIEYLRQIVQKARYGLPDDPEFGLACNKYFVEVLFADDDDGDFENGTPNMEKICKAFDNHGIGLNLLARINFVYTQKDFNINANQPYKVDFQLYTNIGNYTLDSVMLVYSTDNFKTSNKIPVESLGNDLFTASIPPVQNGSIVQFYVSAPDPINDSEIKFGARKDFFFPYYYTVNFKPFALMDDNRSDWAVDKSSSTVSKGLWLWTNTFALDMTGSNQLVQPASTPSGTYCFITGATGSSNFYTSFPDGRTVLASPEFELEAGKNYLAKFNSYFGTYVMSYSQLPSYNVYAAVNGTSNKVVVYNLSQIKYDWASYNLDIRSQFGDINSIRFYFVLDAPKANGYPYNLGSFTKGLLDDFDMYESVDAPQSGVAEDLGKSGLSMGPNPFKNNITLNFAQSGISDVKSIVVYNAKGEMVRSIKNNPQANLITWDGLDNLGNSVIPGSYFIKINTEDGVKSVKVVKE